MPKTIYTERDVEDLARRGVREIAMTENVVVTDVARERAEKLGIALRIPRMPAAGAAIAGTAGAAAGAPGDVEQLVSQVKGDVIAKLGPGVDAALIERIIRRVVSQLK